MDLTGSIANAENREGEKGWYLVYRVANVAKNLAVWGDFILIEISSVMCINMEFSFLKLILIYLPG